MPRQISWNKYEVALLIDAYIKIKSGPSNKLQVLQKLSDDLRTMAKNSGITIDETYRNLNGMQWQYGFIERAFLKTGYGDHMPPKLFQEMVNLYETDETEFQKTLTKAYQLVETKAENTMEFIKPKVGIDSGNREEAFISWLSVQPKLKASANTIVSVYRECSEYATKHNVSKKSILSIDDPKEYSFVARKLLNMKLFRVTHKKTAWLFDKIFPYYAAFLNEKNSFQNKVQTEAIAEKVDAVLVPSLDSFSKWLGDEKKMAPRSCDAYASNLRTLSAFCKENDICDGNLLKADNDSLINISKSIFENEKFVAYNEQQYNRFSAALKKYLEFRLGDAVNKLDFLGRRQYTAHNTSSAVQESRKSLEYQKEVDLVLKNHYPYGYRLESSIEMKRFRRFAESDGISLPESDEQLKTEISSVGFLIEDKIYVITEGTTTSLKTIVNSLAYEGFSILFFEAMMGLKETAMEDNHITSTEMLREIITQKRDEIFADHNDVFLAKNFISLKGKLTENEAVTYEICQTWGEASLRSVKDICESLPAIPESYIRRYLSANKNFVWVSEEKYLYIDRFIISEKEASDILSFVKENCDNYGFASISEAPLESVAEENYKLSQIGLFAAVFNKLLFDEYYLNGRIVTREKSDLNAVELAKQFIGDRDECTFTEVNDRITELTGATNYRYMAYEALYDKMIRIDENRYVSERQVRFDISAIDEVLSGFITDRFVAIKEITSFALFPICGQVWNHYLLEGYCNRYSQKYSLRVTGYNDKNVGIIAERNVTEDYEGLLAKAAARAKLELTPESVGQFFVDAGYMGKRKFKALESVVEKAVAIREE